MASINDRASDFLDKPIWFVGSFIFIKEVKNVAEKVLTCYFQICYKTIQTFPFKLYQVSETFFVHRDLNFLPKITEI